MEDAERRNQNLKKSQKSCTNSHKTKFNYNIYNSYAEVQEIQKHSSLWRRDNNNSCTEFGHFITDLKFNMTIVWWRCFKRQNPFRAWIIQLFCFTGKENKTLERKNFVLLPRQKCKCSSQVTIQLLSCLHYHNVRH